MKRALLTACVIVGLSIALLGKGHAQVGVTTYGPLLFDTPGALPVITLTGEASCTITVDESAGSADITPYGSGDGGATAEVVPPIGVHSATGIFGGPVTPYLTQFYTQVDNVTGTVLVSESCSGAQPNAVTASATPSPVPTFSPTPTPTAVPTPPTPTPSPTPANCPTAIASLAPLAFYKLNETSGTTVSDASGNAYNATINNFTNVLLQQASLASPAPAGDYSYQINNPGYLSAGKAIPLGKTYTLVALVGPLAGSSYTSFCAWWYHGSCLGIRSDGYAGWNQNQGSGAFNGSKAVAITPNARHLLIATINAGVSPWAVLVSVDGGTFANGNTSSLTPGTVSPYTYLDIRRTPNNLDSTYLDNMAVLPYLLTQTKAAQLATACGAPYPAVTPSPTPTPIPPGNYQAAVLALHPFAYYRLDEPSGTTVADLSGNGYNGTVAQPGSTTLGATGLLVSDADTAFAFTANTATVTLGTIPNYKSFTAVFLVKGASYAGNNYAITYAGRQLGVVSNKVRFNYLNTSSQAVGPTLTNATPYWVAIEQNYGANTVSISVNGGTFVTTHTVGWSSSALGTSINRAYASASQGLVGTVDEVALFNTVLTQAQLTALAATAGYSP